MGLINILKREKELYIFFTTTFEKGILLFIKYNFVGFLWRAFGKKTATKFTERNGTKICFKQGGELIVNWLPIFVGIFLDKEYTKYKDFEILSGQTIIDLGANRGYYTYLASISAGRKGKVICVEPYPPNYRLLLSNINSNKIKNTETQMCAISDKNGSMVFYVADESGSHSLISKTGKKIRVKTYTLSRLIRKLKKVDILKMDIEGAELQVLKDTQGLKKVDKIVLETHENAKDAIMLLKKNGYKIISGEEHRLIYAVR